LIDSVVELMVGGLGVVSSCSVIAFLVCLRRVSRRVSAVIEIQHVELRDRISICSWKSEVFI
jgi:hypothetical protein